MPDSRTRLSLSHAPFCVTLVAFDSPEAQDIEAVLRHAGGSLSFTIRRERSASGASYPAEVVHAIVFSLTGLVQATGADVDTVRSATKPGTCRVYLPSASGAASPPAAGGLDDFIQRTPAHDYAVIAEEIIAFFREADKLNRHSTPLAFRDMASLFAFRMLKFLWLVSYVFAALHALNAATVLWGRGTWLGALAPRYVVPASTFFGAFFIVHCIFVIGRNWLFEARIVKRLDIGFALGAAGFGLAAAATGLSVAAMDHSVFRISVSTFLAAGAYQSYMYSRRIRVECTSLSGLQAALADPQRRGEVVSSIGRQRFGHSAFPLFSFRSRSLFISYMHASQWSSKTAVLANQWASEYGFDVFLDRSTIPSGALWRQSLLRAISECGFFVAIIDGDAPTTEWVLAESAYAALLRKSIGKPRILLIVHKIHRIAETQLHPFRLLYLDVFQLPAANCYGAAILPVGPDQLSKERFLQALQAVRPMCLLS